MLLFDNLKGLQAILSFDKEIIGRRGESVAKPVFAAGSQYLRLRRVPIL